jgi:hypothetical protein
VNGPSAVLMASLLLGGCITTRSGPAPTGPWPVASGAALSISVAIQGKVTSNGVPDEIPGAFAGWREQTLKAYRESGCFATVTEGLALSDLHATIEVQDDMTNNEGAHLISAATLFLIPAVADIRVLSIRTCATEMVTRSVSSARAK